MPDTAGPVILVIAVVAVALLCGLGWGSDSAPQAPQDRPHRVGYGAGT